MTVLLVSGDGRSSRELSLPSWVHLGLYALASCVLGSAGFLGFQLQAQYGLHAPAVVALGVVSDVRERWGLFEQLPQSRVGPTRAERVRQLARQRAASLGLGTRRAASHLLALPVPEAWSRAASFSERPERTLLWPVRTGSFGRGYGSGEGGYHLAVDISGTRGSEVVAASAGVVGYVGSELRGYGSTVLLVHPGGWVTLYAHNQRALVVPGERVRQGQAIAELGSTGRSMGPHVHFELIHHGKNCDPIPYFRAASQDPPRMPAFAPVAWRPDAHAAPQVRCGRRRPHPTATDDDEMLGAGRVPLAAVHAD